MWGRASARPFFCFVTSRSPRLRHNRRVLEVVPKPVETVHFRGELAAVGSFRCAVEDPLYRNSGPCSYHTVAFPRTATGIRHDNGQHFVGTPNSVSFYNQGQVYFRDPIAPVDATDWYVFPTVF